MAKLITFVDGQILTAANLNTITPEVPNTGDLFDTGWVDCTIDGSGWTNVASEPVQIRRIGKGVYMRGSIHNNTAAKDTLYRVGSVPPGFAPAQRAPFSGTMNGAANLFIRIETNGNIHVSWHSSGSATATGAWYGFNNVIYLID